MTEFYNITTDLKNALINSPFVNTVTTGGLEDVDLNKKTIFPLSHIIVNSAIPKSQTVSFNVSVIAMDIVDESKETTTNIFVGNDNEQDVLNTQLQVLLRLSKEMTNGQLFGELIQVIGEPTCEPFTDRFENKLAGWTMTFDVEIPNEMTICGTTIPSTNCLDAFIQNSNGSFSSYLASGSNTTLEDVQMSVYDQNDNLLTSVVIPSNIPQSIYVEITPCAPIEVNAIVKNSIDKTINEVLVTPENPNISVPDTNLSNSTSSFSVDIPSCNPYMIPDTEIVLKDTDGNVISTNDFSSCESYDLEAPDGAITVNGSSVGSVKSNGSRALLVKLNGTNSGVYDGINTINVTDKNVFIKGLFQSGNIAMNQLTIDAESVGTFTSTTNDGASGTITFRKNTVVVSLPFTLDIGDILDVSRTITASIGFFKLTGTYA